MHSNYRPCFLISVAALFATAAFFFLSNTTFAQSAGGQYDTKSDPKTNRTRGLNILGQVQEVLEQKYYDEKFRGIDLKERIKSAEETIKKQDMNWQIYRTIAQVLIEFQDSHTRFFPPDRRYRVEYGFTNIIIGDQCFVVDVKKGSDAEKKGLKPGDKIKAIGDFPANRNTLSVINYLIYGLDPQENLKLSVVSSDGKSKELNIASRFLSPRERSDERKKRKREEQDKPYFCSALGADALACKLRTFDTEKESIDKMMKEASTAQKLILDLRGNGGGLVETMLHLIGKFFAEDVVVGGEVSRDKKKEEKADGSGKKAFKGELIVLIDSESASASEVFSRVIQLEKRGKVVGDTSAGAVMTSIGFA